MSSDHHQSTESATSPSSVSLPEELEESEFIQTTPVSLADQRDDSKEIVECITAAVSFFHAQLTNRHRSRIREQWGITDSMIDTKRIGFAPASNELIDHLRDAGFEDRTIVRAGLGSVPQLKHVFCCTPACDTFGHLVSQRLDRLVEARENGALSLAHIDFDRVYDVITECSDYQLRNWWDQRFVFPYRDAEGDFCYLAGRATAETSDIVYDDGTVAKYVKQTVNRPWINTTAVDEPMYGIETVMDDVGLLLTEGITDAILAHQHGIPCVSPATTQFKRKHHDRLAEIASRADRVWIVNDAEESQAGLDGALSTATSLRNQEIDIWVGALPRTDARKLDLAEYLTHHGADDLRSVLEQSVRPRDHPAFDPEKHEPAVQSSASQGPTTSAPEKGTDDSADNEATISPEDPNVSALYALELEDVIPFDSLGITTGGSGVLYSGDNPLGHVGDSHSSYFKIYRRDGRLEAYDHKTKHGYSALTWLACTTIRSTERPQGSLSPQEVWASWLHAKRADHIPVPADDPIPIKAVWHLAAEADLAPEWVIPGSFESPDRLPPTVFNEVLEFVKSEFGIDPGREPRSAGDLSS